MRIKLADARKSGWGYKKNFVHKKNDAWVLAYQAFSQLAHEKDQFKNVYHNFFLLIVLLNSMCTNQFPNTTYIQYIVSMCHYALIIVHSLSLLASHLDECFGRETFGSLYGQAEGPVPDQGTEHAQCS